MVKPSTSTTCANRNLWAYDNLSSRNVSSMLPRLPRSGINVLLLAVEIGAWMADPVACRTDSDACLVVESLGKRRHDCLGLLEAGRCDPVVMIAQAPGRRLQTDARPPPGPGLPGDQLR